MRKETIVMDIAMVNPSLIDARLDRIHRLVDGVNTFRDRLNELLSTYAPNEMDTVAPTQPQTYSSAPMAAVTPSYPTEPIESASPITADDVDIDALLKDIDLSTDFSL